MGFLDRLKGGGAKKNERRRVVVIGIDGTPYTFIQRMLAEKRMPNLARLIAGSSLARMNSVYPTVEERAVLYFRMHEGKD